MVSSVRSGRFGRIPFGLRVRVRSIAAVTALGLFLSSGFAAVLARAQPVPEPASVPETETEPSRLPSVVAQFTTAIEDRAPVDQVTFVSNAIGTIYLYSDLRGLEGQIVTHRWLYGGETKAEVRFEVRGPRWRVWSSKDLLPDWVGDWTVEIVGENGEVIAAETFTYSAPEAVR
jgi:hypothetical protein